jgi:CRISPR-associated protein Cas2
VTKTVRKFRHAATAEQLINGPHGRIRSFEDFIPYLHQRAAEDGVTNAVQLYAEVRALGYRGSRRTVRRYLEPLRAALPAVHPPFPLVCTPAGPDRVASGALAGRVAEPERAHRALQGVQRVHLRIWQQTISADVVAGSVNDGMAVCIHPADNEQGFLLKTAGLRRRLVADFDGLQLVRFLPQEQQRPETVGREGSSPLM